MAGDSSFDVVSEVDRQEADNALQQTAREVGQRFDFRGTDAGIRWSGELSVEMQANSEDRVKAVLDVFKEKLVKRSVPIKALVASPPKPAGGNNFRIVCEVIEGIPDDNAKALAKRIRQAKIKGVQAQVQGDQLRVTGKSRDDLQRAIALLKEHDEGLALQFTNRRG